MNATLRQPDGPHRIPSQSRSRTAVAAAVLAMTLLLAGCGGNPSPIAPATPAPATPVAATPSPIPPPERPLFSGPVAWAAEVDPATGGPTALVDALPADAPRLVAAIRVREGIAPGRVTAAWAYNNTPMPTFDAALDVPSGDGLTWAAFTLAMPEGKTWPIGTYEISLSLDGGPPVTGRIEVPPQP